MKPISSLWPALALLLFAASAGAQTTTPPKLDPIEDAGDSAVNIAAKPSNEAKVSEHREQGVVKEIKVTSGPSTYYIHPNQPSGTSLPGDATSSTATHGPQWKVLEFGGPKKKQLPEEDASDVPPRAQ